MVDWKRPKWVVAIPIAIALGLLEAAWTGPGRGAPTNTWLGVLAIFIIFGFITFPKAWRIPLLAIIEEGTHLFVGYGWSLPTWSTIFAHWSTSFVGFNFAPWILFPLITLIGELAVWRVKKYRVWVISLQQ